MRHPLPEFAQENNILTSRSTEATEIGGLRAEDGSYFKSRPQAGRFFDPQSAMKGRLRPDSFHTLHTFHTFHTCGSAAKCPGQEGKHAEEPLCLSGAVTTPLDTKIQSPTPFPLLTFYTLHTLLTCGSAAQCPGPEGKHAEGPLCFFEVTSPENPTGHSA
jgi:hypothetical protein